MLSGLHSAQPFHGFSKTGLWCRYVHLFSDSLLFSLQGIARIYKGNTILLLVLGGVISSAFFTSLLSIVKYIADPYNQLPAIVQWLMGGLSMVDRKYY